MHNIYARAVYKTRIETVCVSVGLNCVGAKDLESQVQDPLKVREEGDGGR